MPLFLANFTGGGVKFPLEDASGGAATFRRNRDGDDVQGAGLFAWHRDGDDMAGAGDFLIQFFHHTLDALSIMFDPRAIQVGRHADRRRNKGVDLAERFGDHHIGPVAADHPGVLTGERPADNRVSRLRRQIDDAAFYFPARPAWPVGSDRDVPVLGGGQ